MSGPGGNGSSRKCGEIEQRDRGPRRSASWPRRPTGARRAQAPARFPHSRRTCKAGDARAGRVPAQGHGEPRHDARRDDPGRGPRRLPAGGGGARRLGEPRRGGRGRLPARAGRPAEAAARLAPYAVLCLMRERMPLDAGLIARLPNLRLVVFTGARNPSLDAAALARAGVTMCHTGGGGGPATAELATALILACARHLPAEFAGMRAGRWQENVGRSLDGSTLGILGLGRIGARMAAIGRALGMDPVAWSPNLTAERARAAGAALVDRETLLRSSDVLTLHMVLSPRPGASRRAGTRPDEARRDPGEHRPRPAGRRGGAGRGPARGAPRRRARRLRRGAPPRRPSPARPAERRADAASRLRHAGHLRDLLPRHRRGDRGVAAGAPVRVVAPPAA